MNNIKGKAGQSTVEYLVLISAVVAVLIIFLGQGGIFQQRLEGTITSGTDAMETVAARVAGQYN